MKKTPFYNLIFFFGFFLWFHVFSRAIIPTHLLHEGLSLRQILFGVTLGFVGQLIIILSFRYFSKKMTSVLSWQLAIVCSFLYILLVIKINSNLKFYLASVIGGFTTTSFYLFYNIAHFKLTPKEKIGHSSAIMFNIGPIISIAAPLAAGALAEYRFSIIWILSIVFFVFAIYLAGKQESFKIKFNLKEALREIEATRLFIFLEGFWEAMCFGIIPVYTLFFIKTPLNYGTFLAYLSIVAIIANFVLGKYSDKIKKRAVFLYPVTILLAAITFLFPLATKNISTWIIFTGALQFIIPLFWNLSTALVVDAHADLEYAMAARELMLITGRILGLLLALCSFIFEETPFYIFFILGTAMLLFPINLWMRTKISKKYSYL